MSTSLVRADRRAFDPALPAVRKAIDALEQAMGGREELIATLTTSTDPDVDYLLGLIADPRNDERSLSSLCDEGNISPGLLLRAYRQAEVAKAQVLALKEVAKQTPAVAADVMRRAQNHMILCASCRGSGLVWEEIRDAKGKPTGDRQRVPCKGCDGSGDQPEEASLDHQRIALELVGLLAKGGGTQIGIVNQLPTPSGLLPFAALQLAVQKVLQPEPLRAEPPTDPSAEVSEGEVLAVNPGDDPHP